MGNLRILDTRQDKLSYFDLRYRVFVLQQQVPVVMELDAEDFEPPGRTLQLGLYDLDLLVGGARLVNEGCNTIHIGRVVVEPRLQGRGFGREIMRGLEPIAVSKFLDGQSLRLELAAQTHARKFYESLGYRAQGEVFLDAGLPHVAMHKILEVSSRSEDNVGGLS